MSDSLDKLDRNTHAGVFYDRFGEERYACGCGTESKVATDMPPGTTALEHPDGGGADAHCHGCGAVVNHAARPGAT